MTLTINEKTYADLLSVAKPQLITTEIENQQVLSQVEQLMAIDDRTPEQDALFDLLVVLIEKFEEEHYPIDDASPHDILLHLMEENNIKQGRPSGNFEFSWGCFRGCQWETSDQ